jgi:hypothetical protein
LIAHGNTVEIGGGTGRRQCALEATPVVSAVSESPPGSLVTGDRRRFVGFFEVLDVSIRAVDLGDFDGLFGVFDRLDADDGSVDPLGVEMSGHRDLGHRDALLPGDFEGSSSSADRSEIKEHTVGERNRIRAGRDRLPVDGHSRGARSTSKPIAVRSVSAPSGAEIRARQTSRY